MNLSFKEENNLSTICSSQKTAKTNEIALKARRERLTGLTSLQSKSNWRPFLIGRLPESIICGQSLDGYNSVPGKLLKDSQKSEKTRLPFNLKKTKTFSPCSFSESGRKGWVYYCNYSNYNNTERISWENQLLLAYSIFLRIYQGGVAF